MKQTILHLGHVAGIINAPDRNKYGYYFRKDDVKDPEQWKIGAEFVKESWWPFWERWLREKSKDLVEARIPYLSDELDLGDAPGCYVHQKPHL